jgi:cytochrome b pre-mRNA-processing protein 3
MDGRFDMIVLHVALFFRRVRKEAEPVRALGQGVFDRFCADMEHNFREIGLSDVAIPKEMRRVGEAYYGRAAAYDRALAGDDQTGLTEALARNVFADATRVDAFPNPPRSRRWLRRLFDGRECYGRGTRLECAGPCG